MIIISNAHACKDSQVTWWPSVRTWHYLKQIGWIFGLYTRTSLSHQKDNPVCKRWYTVIQTANILVRCACIVMIVAFFNPETSKRCLVVRAVANVHEKNITEVISMIKFSSSAIRVFTMTKIKKMPQFVCCCYSVCLLRWPKLMKPNDLVILPPTPHHFFFLKTYPLYYFVS